MSKRVDGKIKLTAGLFNSAAGPSFTIGVIGPIVAVSINLGGAATKVPVLNLWLNAAFWVSAAVALHVIGRKLLDGLSE